MKHLGLFIITLLLTFAAQAQQINKDLLYGKWNLYSAKKQGVILCIDSLEESKSAFFKLYLEENPGEVITAEDSAEINVMLPQLLAQLTQTYLQFEKGGKAKAFFSLEEDDEERNDIDRNYVWKSANEIDLLKDGKVYTSIKVLSLTADKLTIMKMDEGVANTVVLKKASR
ncbi:MAG: hypothetical protein JST49_08760 [Bacteroidetes bacterium]|nr:hypothetical protein [Bacteroidota bacterium]